MIRVNNLSGTIMFEDNELVKFRVERGEVVFVSVIGTENIPYEFSLYKTPEYALLMFLDDRVVPETRIGLQKDLAIAGISYYDPDAILHLNHGACVSDKYWIQFDGDSYKFKEIQTAMFNNWGFRFN